MNKIEEVLNSRTKENCFRLLSACFYEPRKRMFLEENLFGNLTEGLKQVCPDAVRFSSNMEKCLYNYTGEELRVEYAKLFVGPFDLLAPPYGSVYIDFGGRVMGDSTMKVIEAYQKEGLSKNDDFKDLPDHIAVEMEFMSYLIFKEREALTNSDPDTAREYANKQEDFSNNFIRPWVHQFCGRIQEGTENEFYRSLADCLSVFLVDCKNI
jgi:TorA maturation chaperone TorD